MLPNYATTFGLIGDTIETVKQASRLYLVPRASFPLTSGRKTKALGASILKYQWQTTEVWLSGSLGSLSLHLWHAMAHASNGCSQSSRSPTAGQRERSSGNQIGLSIKY